MPAALQGTGQAQGSPAPLLCWPFPGQARLHRQGWQTGASSFFCKMLACTVLLHWYQSLPSRQESATREHAGALTVFTKASFQLPSAGMECSSVQE